MMDGIIHVSLLVRMSLRRVTRRYKRQALAAQIELGDTKEDDPLRWDWRTMISSMMQESLGPAKGGVHCWLMCRWHLRACSFSHWKVRRDVWDGRR